MRIRMRVVAEIIWMWINDAGYRSYYRGLTMLATVHMRIRGDHLGVGEAIAQGTGLVDVD